MLILTLQEIRQALRMMKPEERHEALNNALKNGEGVIIAAIVDTPTLLTGIDPKLASRYQESLERMKAPRFSCRTVTA